MGYIRLLWRFLRFLWWLIRLPWQIARLPRELLRHRWIRRLVLWFLGRQVRKYGWRASAAYVWGLRGYARTLLVGCWHATVGLFRIGARVARLLAWVYTHTPKVLGQRTRRSLQARVVPGLTAGDGQSSSRLPSLQRTHPRRPRPRSSHLHAPLSRRVAHRRDVIRRSLFAAVGVNPNWRPARKPRSDAKAR